MEDKNNDFIEITDLKDMLNKTKELYGDKIAYKIRKKKAEPMRFCLFYIIFFLIFL